METNNAENIKAAAELSILEGMKVIQLVLSQFREAVNSRIRTLLIDGVEEEDGQRVYIEEEFLPNIEDNDIHFLLNRTDEALSVLEDVDWQNANVAEMIASTIATLILNARENIQEAGNDFSARRRSVAAERILEPFSPSTTPGEFDLVTLEARLSDIELRAMAMNHGSKAQPNHPIHAPLDNRSMRVVIDTPHGERTVEVTSVKAIEDTARAQLGYKKGEH